ncbi:MAG TPA: S8 family serine peptidase [Longimicrobiales bacterium]|nr:S8 family serine peptidase [Longimicrobiales bacterium]
MSTFRNGWHLVLIGGFLAACSDSRAPTGPAVDPPEVRASLSATALSTSLAQQTVSRRETPWFKMTDDELAAKVEEAGGRVFIGFKEPAAAGGVDERGRILVSAATVKSMKEDLRASGVSFYYEYDGLPAISAKVPVGMVKALRANPRVDYIEPIFPGTWSAQDTTWNVRQVGAPTAWPKSTGAGIKVGILDSGAGFTHPDLSYPASANCVDQSSGVDTYGHGTFVAGIIGAVNNTSYVIGTAHGAQLWSIKVGDTTPMPDAVVCGVITARANGIFAVNLSLTMAPYTPLTDEIADDYYQHGMMFIAAAGNTFGGAVGYPASLDEVIAVTATDNNNNRASFAAIGPQVELAAPGVAVVSTSLPSGLVCTTGGYTATCDGTSFAAPHVAAAAAILKAYYPSWSNFDIRQRLQATATDLGNPGRDSNYGYGLLNLAAAVPPNPSVNISGPTCITSKATYTWQANPSGGDGQYSYQWSVHYYNTGQTITLGTAQSQSLTVFQGDGDFEMRVTITSLGRNASDTHFVDEAIGSVCGATPIAGS